MNFESKLLYLILFNLLFMKIVKMIKVPISFFVSNQEIF